MAEQTRLTENKAHVGIQTVPEDCFNNQDKLIFSTPKGKSDRNPQTINSSKRNHLNHPMDFPNQHQSILQDDVVQRRISGHEDLYQQPNISYDDLSQYMTDRSLFTEQRNLSGQRSGSKQDGMQRELSQTKCINDKDQTSMREQQQQSRLNQSPTKPPKEKKSISTKTFAHGLMDVSLLTTHASQLRTVLSNKEHEFYTLLVWMIGVSIALQVLSGILLLTSDFFKTQDKVKDRQNQKKRKVLSFISLCIVGVNTPMKILISAFYISHEPSSVGTKSYPMFSPSTFPFQVNHTEL